MTVWLFSGIIIYIIFFLFSLFWYIMLSEGIVMWVVFFEYSVARFVVVVWAVFSFVLNWIVDIVEFVFIGWFSLLILNGIVTWVFTIFLVIWWSWFSAVDTGMYWTMLFSLIEDVGVWMIVIISFFFIVWMFGFFLENFKK